MFETISKNIKDENIKTVIQNTVCFDEDNSKKRAIISLLGIKVFSEYLEEKGIEYLTDSNLHSSCYLIKKFDIADIRTTKDVVIEIRAVTGDDYSQMCIPKEHFSLGIDADIYVGVKINKELKKAELMGYILTDDVSRAKGNENYIIIGAEELKPLSEIEKTINTIEKNPKKYISADHEKVSGLMFSFIDGLISREEEKYFIEHLSGCFECRKKLVIFSETDKKLKSIKDKLSLDENHNIRLLTGDPVIKGAKEYPDELKEETEDYIEETEDNVEELQALEKVFGQEMDDKEIEFIQEDEKQEEPSLTSHEEPQKKKNYRDWADELIDEPVFLKPDTKEPVLDLNNIEEDIFENSEMDIKEKSSEEIKPEEQEVKEELGENIIKLEEEKIPQKSLREEEEEFILNEENISAGLDEDLLKKESDEGLLDLGSQEEEVLINYKEENLQEKSSSGSELNPKLVDEELENILETLDDVEEINAEEDIDSLLSFIDHEDYIKTENIENEEKPSDLNIVKEQQKEEVKENNVSISKKQEKQTEKSGDYSKILSSSNKEDDSDMDIIIYEESKEKINEITQEDLLSIFDPTSLEEENRKKQEAESLSVKIKRFTSDKNKVAVSAAVTISATLLLFYFGQIGNQDKTTLVKNKNNEQTEKQKDNEKLTENNIEKRERTPLKTYTREIMKTVKNKKISNNSAKQEIERIFNEQEEKENNKKEIITPSFVEIKNISWELGSSVARKPKIKKYFLDTGYILKDTLSKALSKTGIEINKAKISIYAELDSNGNILKSFIFNGSGIQKVDEISINEMRRVLKSKNMPKGIPNNEQIKFKLLIRI